MDSLPEFRKTTSLETHVVAHKVGRFIGPWCAANRDPRSLLLTATTHMAPRLALAQSVLWQSLRTQLRADVAGTATSSRLLKSFDSLPYRSNIGRSWLPDADDLRAVVGGSLSDSQLRRLEQSAESARVQLLQAASASDDPRGHVIDVIDKGARQGHLHAVLLQNQSSVDLELLMANCVVQLRRGELRLAMQDIRREFSEFTISEPRLRWLRAVHYARQGTASPSELLFRTDLFRMLARYEGLAGLNGAGNQAAVPHQVYSCFESWAGAPNGSAVEAFASPLNHRMEPTMESRVQFGSAFPDVDAPFGSLGRFTELPRLPRGCAHSHELPRLPRGSNGRADGRTDGRTSPSFPRGSAHTLVLANPPFFQPILDALEPKLWDLLHAAPDAIALCVVPATGAREPSEAPHVQALRASPLTRGSVNLPAGEHAYASGVAHRLTWREPSATRRSTRHRWPSRYATEVFVMAAQPLEHRGVRELLESVRVAFGVEDPNWDRHATADLHASTDYASTDGQASTDQHAPAPSRHRLRVVAASSVASSTASSADSRGAENLELEKGTRLFGCAPSAQRGPTRSQLFGCAPSGPAQRDLFDEVLLEASQRDAAAREALAHAKKRQNTRVYNRLLKNASDHRILSVVEEAVEQMRRDGVPENEFTTALRINAFARVGRIEDATAVVREAEARGLAPLQSNASLEPLIKGIIETRFGPPGVGPELTASRRPATAISGHLNRHPDQSLSLARLPQAHLSGTRPPPPSAARRRILSALHLVHDRLGVAGSEPPNWRTVNTLLRACKRWDPELGPHVLHSFDASLHQHPSTLVLCAEIACANLDLEGAKAAVEGLRAQAIPPDPRLLIGLALAMALRGDLGGASATIDAAAASIESIALKRDTPPQMGTVDARAEGNTVAIHPLIRRGVPMQWLQAEHAMVARFVAEGGGVQEDGEASEGAEQWGSSEGGASGSSTALMSSPISSPFRRSPLVSWPRELEAWTATDRLHRLLTSKAASRVEVGAGSGDWLVAQAAAQPDVAWVAIEPQVDRVYHIWSKVQMHRLSNVHICATDASDVLRREGGLMKPIIGSVDAIYLRFPFPPSLELRDLARTSPSPDALLNGAFLADAARVLRPLGSLQILTNEPTCCALMLAILQTHPAGSAFRSIHGRDGFAKSSPTPATALDDSFFDAVLADRGRRLAHERYELHLRKVA